MSPIVSVILPVFNGESFLFEAIQSILDQSFTDFELIILDDGSEDNTLTIIESFKDERIVLYKNESNIGLIATLNKGFRLAKGKYIARMDADDISMSNRFALQVSFLDNNPDYIICSSSRKVFKDSTSEYRIEYLPLSHEEILVQNIFNSSFTHPCVMLRRSIIEKIDQLFLPEFKYAEDYEFWIRLLKYGKGANFKQPLLFYRDVATGETKKGESSIEKRAITIKKIQCKALESIGVYLSSNEINLLYRLSLSSNIKAMSSSKKNIDNIRNLLNKMDKIIKDKNIKCASKTVFGKVYLKVYIYHFKSLSLRQNIKMFFDKYTFYGLRGILRSL